MLVYEVWNVNLESTLLLCWFRILCWSVKGLIYQPTGMINVGMAKVSIRTVKIIYVSKISLLLTRLTSLKNTSTFVGYWRLIKEMNYIKRFVNKQCIINFSGMKILSDRWQFFFTWSLWSLVGHSDGKSHPRFYQSARSCLDLVACSQGQHHQSGKTWTHQHSGHP